MSNAVAQQSETHGSVWSGPIGSAPKVVPPTFRLPDDAAAIDLEQRRAMASRILDEAEAAAGRPFDEAWRDGAVTKLSAKPVADLESILRNGSNVVPNYLGSTQADLTYTPVSPCRVIDTRTAGGPIAAGTSRDFRVTGTNFSAQGGTSGNCGVPFGPATATVINITAIGAQATGNGNLNQAAFGTAFTTAAVINWTVGVNVANAVTVPMCDPNVVSCTSDISLKANVNGVNVVADVLGYFARPQATALDVQAVYNPPAGFSCSSLFNCQVSAVCNSGYTVTGGGCEVADTNSAYLYIWYMNMPSGNGWLCKGTNTAGVAQTVRAWAMCSRVPGR